jgi:Putative Actinobacterial Holin-X, holin superfamily III
MAQRSTAVTEGTAAVTRRDRSSEPLSVLLHRVLEKLSILFRQEVALAGAEVSRSLTTLFMSFVSVATGGAVLYAGLLLVLLSAVLGLGYLVPLWLSSLLVGVAVGVVGYIVLAIGRNKLKSSELLPTHSPESLRRDKDVMTRSGS